MRNNGRHQHSAELLENVSLRWGQRDRHHTLFANPTQGGMARRARGDGEIVVWLAGDCSGVGCPSHGDTYAVFFAARAFAHLARCAFAMRAFADADICRFVFFRPLADSAARVLPKAFTAAPIAFNCRSTTAFTFVSFRASFCNAASSFIRLLPATSYAK